MRSQSPPTSARCDRRTVLAASAALAAHAWVGPARSMGRVPLRGQLLFRVPWGTRVIDPHELCDPLAAYFAHALVDPLYALDAQGRPYPALADGMPFIEDGQTFVRLRPGVRTGRGRSISGRDLAWSLRRARKRGAAGLLAPLGSIRADESRPLVVRLGRVPPLGAAKRLASLVTAIVPTGYSPTAPDGTGAFVARLSKTQLELRRNTNAARGPSFLERVVVRSAPDVATSLRAFEAGQDDLGWLGLGLYGSRPRARSFDYGDVGWAVLATGRQAGSFGAPGMAQQLANAVPVEQLPTGLRARRGSVGSPAQWGGGPTSLYVPADGYHLRAVAAAVAAKLSSPGHELEVVTVSAWRLRRLLRGREFGLLVHPVRRLGSGALAALTALATAERPALGRDIARHPPRLQADTPAHQLTTSLRVGVLGGLSVIGGTAPTVTLAAARPVRCGMDLAASYRV